MKFNLTLKTYENIRFKTPETPEIDGSFPNFLENSVVHE
jgi:hypothetical protein